MAAPLILHEQRWLPHLAGWLTIPIPAPVRVGKPALGYPWHWSVVPWLADIPADQHEPDPAARDVGADTPAGSAARAAGQAVATAHVPRHAYGPAVYAQQATYRAAEPAEADAAVASERDWQYQRLPQLRESKR